MHIFLRPQVRLSLIIHTSYLSVRLYIFILGREGKNGGVNLKHGLDSARKLSKEDQIALWLMYSSVFVDWLAAYMVFPMLPFLAEELDINNQQLSYLFASYSFSSIMGGVLIGIVTAKFGTRWGILYSMLGSGVTLVIAALSPTFEMLLAARFLGGLTGNSIPVAMIYISMKVPSLLRPRYMSYVGLCVTSSVIVGPLLGGSLSIYGLKVPFFFASAIAFVGAIFASRLVPKLIPPKRTALDPGRLTGRNYLMLFFSLCHSIPYSATISMLGPYMIEVFDLIG